MLIKRMTTKQQIGVGMLIVVFGIIVYVNLADKHSTVEVENTVATSTVAQQVELPAWAEDEDAVKAAQDVLRKKELEAELESLTVEREAIQERINEVEKELGVY